MKAIKSIHRQIFILLIILKFHLSVSTTTTTNNKSNNNEEVTIPVLLWDSYHNPAVAPDNTKNGALPPRYLIGMVGGFSSSSSSSKSSSFLRNHRHLQSNHNDNDENDNGNNNPSPTHYFTFDLGNNRESIFSSADCLACNVSDTHCPKTVPTCDDSTTNSTFCWPSQPDQFLPTSSFDYLPHTPCPSHVTPAGPLPDHHNPYVTTCIQCFDNGDHSRFFSPAASSQLNLVNRNGSVVFPLPSPFSFGAAVRTVPVIDRVWSNVGIGYGSSFLTQTGFRSLYLKLSVPEVGRNEIVFNPDPSRYRNNATRSVPFLLSDKNKRLHEVSYFAITGDDDDDGNRRRAYGESSAKPVIFHVDSGNDGISLNDTHLVANVATMTGGSWLANDEPDPANYGTMRLYVPYGPDEAETWTVALLRQQSSDDDDDDDDESVVEVSYPGWRWVIRSFHGEDYRREDGLFPTIFVTYNKNVLGLPFLSPSDVDLVFDDELLRLFLMDRESHN